MTTKDIRTYKKYLNDLKGVINLHERDINKWCDLIELLCYTSKDKILFREDIESELESFLDGGIQLASLKEVSKQMGFDVIDTHIFSNNGKVDWGSDDASKQDLLDQLTNLWFSHLQLRQKEFKNYYPFKIKPNRSEISCKAYSSLSKANKLYLYFILASKRNGLNLSIQRNLEFSFEPIAFQAFKSLLPNRSHSYLMGKGTYTAIQFRTNKFNKFKLLADALKVQIKVTPNYFSPKDSGENGIDFIGWVVYSDLLPNNSVFSGQATCMIDWQARHYESSKQEMGGLLDTSKIGSYTNALFIPYHFKVGNNWAYHTYVEGKEYVLFDRFRIINNIDIKRINNNLIPIEIIKAIGQ